MCIPKYEKQLARLHRWYERFKQIDQGMPHRFPSEYYEDKVYAFFINCYHLKDWIINDDSIQINRKERKQLVENFINQNECMRICADICNGIKHLKLQRIRSDKQPEFKSKHYSLTLGGGVEPIISVKFYVETAKGKVDAFVLATECLRKWVEFIENNIKRSKIN